jgi:hypothetical protein
MNTPTTQVTVSHAVTDYLHVVDAVMLKMMTTCMQLVVVIGVTVVGTTTLDTAINATMTMTLPVAGVAVTVDMTFESTVTSRTLSFTG